MVDKLPLQCPEEWIKKLTSCLLPWICISAWTGFLIFIVMKPNQGATFLLSFILYSKACWKVFANKQIISLLKWMHSMSPSIWATVQKVHHQKWIFVLFLIKNKVDLCCIISYSLLPTMQTLNCWWKRSVLKAQIIKGETQKTYITFFLQCHKPLISLQCNAHAVYSIWAYWLFLSSSKPSLKGFNGSNNWEASTHLPDSKLTYFGP